MRDHFVRALLPLLLLSLLAGCTSYVSSRQAELAGQQGKWDDAVLDYLKALDRDPENIKLRAALMRAKIKASQAHFEKGKQYAAAAVNERALVEYQQAVQLDPTNQYAKAELDRARSAYEAARQNREMSSIEEMKKKTRGARPQPPILNPRSTQPISLEFPQPVSIFDIYRALGKAFGINILFDPNLKDQEIAIDLKDVDAKGALEFLMRAAGHFYKVMDEQSIIIAADTPQNRRTYEDLVIQTFFLSNAEVKDMTTILRSLIDAKKIATNEQLNAIILRDTADKVKVAERIIEANDKSKAEVVIDVELLQINTSRLRDLGVSLDSYQVKQTLDTGSTSTTIGGTTTSTPSPIHVSDLQFLNQSNWALTIPSFVYNFVKQSTDAQLLAKPQLRISEGEKANLVIGDKVPIPLTTFNTSNTVGGSIVPITSFQYQDVGIRIDMEPRVHHNQEVTLKVKVEVSQLNGSITGSGGQSQPIIGTRTIDSTIRLKDGETNFMAGLIRTDESNTENGFPGLSEIPILGRLFSHKNTSRQRTDVILTITPHIIRQAQITEEDLLPIWVGTEANISFRAGSPRVESDVEGPFETEGTPEQIQDAIRRRIQRLPRGLRPGDDGAAGAPGAPGQPPPNPPRSGIDLAPVKPPTDIFRPPTSAAPPPPPVENQPPPGSQSSLEEESAPVAAGVRTAASAATHSIVATTAESRAPAAKSAARTAAVQLWLTPQSLKVAPGERFEVRIEAAATAAVSHLPLSISFDPKVLAVEKVEAGAFLGGAGEAEVLSDGTSLPGELIIGASRLGQVPGVTGAGTLLRVTFRALAAGRSGLEFHDSTALGAGLKPLTLATRPAVVEVGGEGRPERPEKNRPPAREASGPLGG